MTRFLPLAVAIAACSTEPIAPTIVKNDPGPMRADLPPPPAAGGTFQPLANRAPFNAAMSLLLTDGTVMVQQLQSGTWWRLTPDASGDYVHGAWSQLATMPNQHAPLYFASAVLPDGKVIVMGGEYNMGAQSETTKGSFYDPQLNSWTTVAAPTGWSTIGDAVSIVLADGRFMMADCCSNKEAILDRKTMTWNATGAGKQDQNSEETWTLLPDNKVLTVDVFNGGAMASELYDPTTGMWANAGSTKVKLADAGFEIGPGVLRFDGTVWVAGATGHSAVFDTHSKTWAIGPDFPLDAGKQLDVADGPGVLLPNGKVLTAASPGDYMPPSHFFEFDGTALTEVAAPPNAPSDPSYVVNFLVLPTGQILTTDFTSDVQIYTPAPANTDAYAPIIESLPTLVDGVAARETPHGPGVPLPLTTLHHGRTYEVWIQRMNGLSQGSYYGDDAQGSSNYPLVRLTNMATGHVAFARTHDHSTQAIGPDVEGTTHFDIPASVERGASTMQVVTNGIASPAVAVEVD